jgi:hypothetical protein
MEFSPTKHACVQLAHRQADRNAPYGSAKEIVALFHIAVAEWPRQQNGSYDPRLLFLKS